MRAHPLVTVIVPTRNRADTLKHTLRTCTMQDYDRLEILVSDNFSEDDTAEVIAAVRDPRLKCVKTNSRLGMSQNWEFALSHVEDGYVIVVGDDDALLPNAIRDIVSILEETGCEAMAWREAKYHWPGCGGMAAENLLRVPLGTRRKVRSAREAVRQVVTYAEPYSILPSLYWGVLHRDALRRATGPTGRFFQSLNPDIYSAIAGAMVIDRYVWSERPYRLSGHSHHSTGASFSAAAPSAVSPRAKFLSETNLEFHRDFVLTPSKPVYVAESYQQAREHVPGGSEHSDVSLEVVFDQMMRVAASDLQNVYPMVIQAIVEMAQRAGKEALAREIIAKYPYRKPDRPGAHVADAARFAAIRHPTLKLNGDDFAVRDVHGAAVLCHSVIRLFEAGYLSPAGIARRVVSAVRGRLAAYSGSDAA